MWKYLAIFLFISFGANASEYVPASGLYLFGSPSIPGQAPAATQEIYVTSNGNVGIGTTTPQQALHVVGTIRQTTQVSCATGLTTNSSGDINGCVASDERLKTDIKPLTYAPLLIDSLRPIQYRWKDTEKYDAKLHNGFIAQEVQQLDPFAIKKAGGDFIGIDNSALEADIVLDLQAIHQELRAEHNAFPFHKCFFDLLMCPN